jgi:hypothetical protein
MVTQEDDVDAHAFRERSRRSPVISVMIARRSGRVWIEHTLEVSVSAITAWDQQGLVKFMTASCSRGSPAGAVPGVCDELAA